jgi:hypothetical protein
MPSRLTSVRRTPAFDGREPATRRTAIALPFAPERPSHLLRDSQEERVPWLALLELSALAARRRRWTEFLRQIFTADAAAIPASPARGFRRHEAPRELH